MTLAGLALLRTHGDEAPTLTVSVTSSLCESGSSTCTRAPAPGVSVTLSQGGRTVDDRTGPDGQVHFTSLDDGPVHLRTHVGERTVERDVVVTDDTFADVSLGDYFPSATP